LRITQWTFYDILYWAALLKFVNSFILWLTFRRQI